MRKKIVFLILLYLSLLSSVDLSAAQDSGPRVGDRCPPFSTSDAAGNSCSRDQLRDENRTTVIFFWALRCAPCLREMDYLDQIYRRFKDRGLMVLAVEAGGNDYRRIAETMEKLKAVDISPSYPIIADPDFALSRAFGVEKTPHTYLIDRSGVLTLRFEGFSGPLNAQLIAKIEESLERETERAYLAGAEEPAEEALSIISNPVGKYQSIRKKEEEFDKNFYYAKYYHYRKEHDGAAPYYEKCLELDPESVYVRLRLGELLVLKKEFSKARKMWEDVLKLDPGNKEADFNLRRLVREVF